MWPVLVHGVYLTLPGGSSSDEETHYWGRMSPDTVLPQLFLLDMMLKRNKDKNRKSSLGGKHECGTQETEGAYLVTIPCKAATFHGARVEVTLIVELEHRQAGVDVVEHRGQATPQGKELRPVAVEPHTHGALEGQVATVAQERTERQRARGPAVRHVGQDSAKCTASTSSPSTSKSPVRLYI